MKDAFLSTTEQLDATAVEAIFPISSWSLEGSNRFKREKKTVTHWRDLLQDLEGNAYLHIFLFNIELNTE